MVVVFFIFKDFGELYNTHTHTGLARPATAAAADFRVQRGGEGVVAPERSKIIIVVMILQRPDVGAAAKIIAEHLSRERI